jgi:hypothetical protein
LGTGVAAVQKVYAEIQITKKELASV